MNTTSSAKAVNERTRKPNGTAKKQMSWRDTSYQERAVQRIRDANFVTMLIDFVSGRREMTSLQVNTALKMVNKALPDIKSVEIKHDVNHTVTKETINGLLLEAGLMPEAEWASAKAVDVEVASGGEGENAGELPDDSQPQVVQGEGESK